MNGTLLTVTELRPNIVVARVVNGSHAGSIVFIPRMKLQASQQENQNCVPLHRVQFPLRPAFAMTVNKSQGQTLKQMSLYLEESVFTHGQFYVALSRCGCRANVKVMVKGGVYPGREGVYTRNVVYKEALQILQMVQ